MTRFLLLTLSLALSANASSYFVATNGMDGGSGTFSDPLTITKAIASDSPAIAGDTVWVRGGTYAGLLSSYLAGTPSQPIVMRNYNGEHVILDSQDSDIVEASTGLILNGSNTWYWGMEIMNSFTNRVALWRSQGVLVYGPGTKLVNCVIHDVGNGVFTSVTATNSEISGCIVYYNGWQPVGVDRGYGHGLYGQNDFPTKTLRDNVLFNQFDLGIQLYTAGLTIDNFSLLNNIGFSNGTLSTNGYAQNYIIGGVPMTGLLFSNNISWMPSSVGLVGAEIVWASADNGTAVISSNYFGGAAMNVKNWTNLTFTFNTFDIFNQSVNFYHNTYQQSYTWNNNAYRNRSSAPFCYYANGSFVDCPSFSAWKSAYGYDSNSTFTSADPSVTLVKLFPNPYETGRAHIAVMNWANTDNVTVDVSSVLTNGSPYRVRDIENLQGGVLLSGTYTSGTLSIPMTNLVVAAPIGVASPPHTAPAFGVFLLDNPATNALPNFSSATANTATVGTLRGP